jgi:hypothetical protein
MQCYIKTDVTVQSLHAKLCTSAAIHSNVYRVIRMHTIVQYLAILSAVTTMVIFICIERSQMTRPSAWTIHDIILHLRIIHVSQVVLN